MSALADALSTAQAKALGALQKAYVSGALDAEEMVAKMAAFGCTDVVDAAMLLHALDVLKDYGAQPPAPGYAERRTTDTPTDAQRTLIEKLTKGFSADQVPDLTGVTRAQASELIDSLKAGTYDASKWTVPF